jgi:uncharacterized protein
MGTRSESRQLVPILPARSQGGDRPCYTEVFIASLRAVEVCVFLNLRELELRKVQFDEDFPAGEIDFDLNQVRQVGPLHAQGVAELLNNTLDEIRVRGHVRVEIEVPCDRCLEPVHFLIDRDFDLFYRPEPEDEDTPHDLEIDPGETEIGYYKGAGMELADVLREFVLLSLPMQLVCSAECAGICPKCGKNRNTAPCDCIEEPVNDRWSALRDWKQDNVRASKN